MSQQCPACGRSIHPSEIPVRLRNSFPCPSCGEWLMYDTSNFTIIGAVSFGVVIFVAWSLGYRDTSFVLVVLTATPLLWIVCASLIGVFIPITPMKRYKRMVWFTYDHRYSPAIWAVSYAAANVIAFCLGLHKESLDKNAMFMFVVICLTYLLGFLGNFLLGILIPRPPNQAEGDPFSNPVSLHLTDRLRNDKKTNP
jgi:hypothetical protein